jgi:hypothetical protein
MNKFLMSSADPKKLSLMVKGFLVGLIPVLMIFTGASEADLNGIIGYISEAVFLVTSFYAVGAALYGALRKLYLGRWHSVE